MARQRRPRPAPWSYRRSKPGAVAAVPKGLDVNRPERVEAVEIDRGIGGRVGAGRIEPELVAALQVGRQGVAGLVVEDVRGVAGRAGEHNRGFGGIALRDRANAIADRLSLHFRQTTETADVEID